MAKTTKTAKPTKKASAKKATPTKATKSSPAPEARIAREVLPIPDLKHVGLTTYDAKDPNTKYPHITTLRPPMGAPNVMIVWSTMSDSAPHRHSADHVRHRWPRSSQRMD